MPASCKTDPLLAMAKPIRDGGSASEITYLRRGEKNCSEAAVEREESDYVKETTLQTPRSVKEGEEALEMSDQTVFPCNL